MIDNTLIEFVKVNFPEEAKELKQGCINIHFIIDSIIDKLIDKGSNVLKEQRDFDLASKYTQKAEALFKLNKLIEDSLKNVMTDMNALNDMNTMSETNNVNNIDDRNNIDNINEEDNLYGFNKGIDQSFYNTELDNDSSEENVVNENGDDDYNKYYDSLRFK